MNSSSPIRSRHATTIAAGFTLVELMVVIVIAAVLLAIAIPSYQTSILKSRRTDARTALLEERYLSINNVYTNSPANLGYVGSSSSTNFPITIGSGYYQLNLPTTSLAVGAAPPSFTLTATPQGNQANDTSCATFTLTSTGAQSSVDSGGADSTATCWQ